MKFRNSISVRCIGLCAFGSLSKYVGSYEQLRKLVSPFHFDKIKLTRDTEQLAGILFAYSDTAEINIYNLVTPDFLARLDHACNHRWGLVIELLIDVLIEAKLNGKTQLQTKDFAEQFALKTGDPKRYSPFTVPNYLEVFDPQRLYELYQ
ncbi:hypothetical protein [Roseovarius albus]|uniref:hypothetical protein n=1 Tax=Roseovarius albus TaxID=1247867 RepID=UPI000A269B20|nr:hypothetical protein [Roseovarius albus]